VLDNRVNDENGSGYRKRGQGNQHKHFDPVSPGEKVDTQFMQHFAPPRHFPHSQKGLPVILPQWEGPCVDAHYYF
jgi:hypothetical protein